MSNGVLPLAKPQSELISIEINDHKTRSAYGSLYLVGLDNLLIPSEPLWRAGEFLRIGKVP